MRCKRFFYLGSYFNVKTLRFTEHGLDHWPPNKTDDTRQGLAFMVEITAASLDEATVIVALCGDDHEDADNFKVENFTKQNTQAAIRHHRASTYDENIHTKLLLVFDSEGLEELCVLLVSLEEYYEQGRPGRRRGRAGRGG